MTPYDHIKARQEACQQSMKELHQQQLEANDKVSQTKDRIQMLTERLARGKESRKTLARQLYNCQGELNSFHAALRGANGVVSGK